MSLAGTTQKLFAPACAALLLASMTGCTAFQTMCSNKWLDVAWVDPGATVAVNDVLTFWHNQIVITQDPTRNNASLPGLAGRVMLFNDASGKSLDARGKVIVKMFDVPPRNGQPKQLGEWTFDTESLKLLKRKDRISDGYTLFLPWMEYRPDIKQVNLQVCYVPDQGAPRWGALALVTLNSEPQAITSTEEHVMPAGLTTPGRN